MSFNFFSWLRRKAYESVMGGVSDALTELNPGDPPPDLEAARKLMAAPPKQLAAKPEKVDPKKEKGS